MKSTLIFIQFVDGQWTGMVGELVEGKVDLLTGLSVSFERSKVMDFSYGILNSHTTLFSGQRSIGSENSLRSALMYVNVFSTGAWVAIILMGLMFGVTAVSMSYFIGSVNTMSETIKVFSHGSVLFGMALLQLECLFGRASSKHQFRLFNFSAWMTGLMLFAWYTSDLTSYMIVPERVSLPSTYKEIKEGGYSLSVLSGTVSVSFVIDAAQSDSMARDVYEKLKSFETWDDGTLALELLDDPKRLIIVSQEQNFLNYKSAIKSQKFLDGFRQVTAYGYQKDSDIGRLLDFHMLKLKQEGLLNKIVTKWLEQGANNMEDKIFVEPASAIGPANVALPTLI